MSTWKRISFWKRSLALILIVCMSLQIVGNEGFIVYASDAIADMIENNSIHYELANTDIDVLYVYQDDTKLETDVEAYLEKNPLKNGLELSIDSVTMDEFNQSPVTSLKNAEGKYQYDAVIIGACDGEKPKDISGLARKELKDYIDAKYGLFTCHDTVCVNDYGKDLMELDGIGYYADDSTATPTDGTHYNMDMLMLEQAKLLTNKDDCIGSMEKGISQVDVLAEVRYP